MAAKRSPPPKRVTSSKRSGNTKVQLTKSKKEVVGNSPAEKKAKEAASFEGVEPHEWLAMVARGDCIKQRRLVIEYHKSGVRKGLEKNRTWLEEDYYPSFDERKDAAKAAAPYFAPRLAVQQTNLNPGGGKGNKTLAEIMKDVAEKLPS